MPTKCCVRGCSGRGNGHMFPRDEPRKKLWLIAIRRKNYKPTIYAKVCKKHFAPEDYTLPKDSVIENPLPILKKDAVPSIFSWNDTEGETGEANQNLPKRKRRMIYQKTTNPPVKPKVVQVSNNPVLKVPGLAEPIKAKLMRVPNDSSLIARLEAARKALAAKPKVSKTCNAGTTARSDTVETFKPIGSSFKCLAFDPRLKRQTVTKPCISPNLNVGLTTGYQMKIIKSNAIPSNEIIQARRSPYTVPIEEIKIEMDTESEENYFTPSSMNMPCKDPLYTGCISSQAIKIEKDENVNPTPCTADPASQVDLATPYVDRIMRIEEIKKEKNFVAVEIGRVEVEFESKVKDTGVQCNIGDPCCSISLRKKTHFTKEYNNSSLKNFKRRRISV